MCLIKVYLLRTKQYKHLRSACLWASGRLRKIALSRKYAIVPHQFRGFQDALKQKRIEEILDGLEGNEPGRCQTII